MLKITAKKTCTPLKIADLRPGDAFLTLRFDDWELIRDRWLFILLSDRVTEDSKSGFVVARVGQNGEYHIESYSDFTDMDIWQVNVEMIVSPA